MRPPLPKLLPAFLALALLTSCAVSRPPVPPSLELPKPVTDLHAVRRGTNVFLSWTVPAVSHGAPDHHQYGRDACVPDPGRDHERVRRPGGNCACTPNGPTPKSKKDNGPPKITANFVDALPPELLSRTHPGTLTYAIEVLNESHRSAGLSNLVQVAAVPVLPPPFGFKAEVRPDGVHLSWSEPPPVASVPAIHHIYRVYRRPAGGSKDAIAGEAPLVPHSWWTTPSSGKRPSLIEQPRSLAVSEEGKPDVQVEGDDTPPVSVFANDVFPPVVPSGLQAVFSGVGQQPFIDLIWSTGGEADLAGYNVFRHEPGTQPAKVNSELIKTPSLSRCRRTIRQDLLLFGLRRRPSWQRERTFAGGK